MEGHWEELPLPALQGIFAGLEFRQRLSVAFSVCSGWARAAGDPRCWETTSALSDSPDEFFIKVDEPVGEPSLDRVQAIFSKKTLLAGGETGGGIDGLVRLKELVRLSQGRIKSLCLSPFLTSEGGRPNDDQLLAFIADRLEDETLNYVVVDLIKDKSNALFLLYSTNRVCKII